MRRRTAKKIIARVARNVSRGKCRPVKRIQEALIMLDAAFIIDEICHRIIVRKMDSKSRYLDDDRLLRVYTFDASKML